MGAVERLVLSPWEKWTAHGRFPYKLTLHVALVLLTFAQMQLYDAQNAAYMRASHRNWAFFFLPPAADIGVVRPRFQRDFYTINRTMTAVHYLRDAYFSIGNDSVANYEYLRTSSGDIQPLKLTVDRVLPQGDLETRQYLVSQDEESVGPFNPKMSLWQKKHLFRSLRALKFSFPLRDHQFGNFYEECFEWQVNVRFEVIESAQIHAQLEDCEVSRCASTHPRPFWATAKQSFVWLHVVIVVVSILYMMLSLKALRRSFQVVARARGSWGEIPLSLKLKLLNGLQVIVFTSLALLLASTMWSLLFLEAHMPIRFWHRLLHATALLLLWSSLVGYLEHNQHIYSIVLTLNWGTPRVLQFLLGVSPIFFGYALFGTIYFGNKIEEFGTLSASMITLFSLMNGDIIMDTFDAMELHQFTVSGKVFLYSFISLFMYVVLNIFIAIVEEAFFATQSTRRRLSNLLSDPSISGINVTKGSDISAEMLRSLLQLMDSE
ncbi:mucolipin-like protein [Phytophthora infestans T30-4]|uniref:Mucolipin-like protein n=1 Tax=Phytophthora infestans (strain T30-4) TaxID=403677 RepID=D0NJS9_PHYIT|nr:mucolipin-like protein [Phytophthora infestans T30-4]EEY60015.1 mucolipin-like protein [Phytophthora infestans T30-4]|eukprot:XP_002900700.1 mucolipin-like protein [Phytophthora infestans T30-4]